MRGWGTTPTTRWAGEVSMGWTRVILVNLLAATLISCGPGAAGRTAEPGPAGPAGPSPETASASAPAGPLEKIVLALPSVSGVFIPHVLAQQQGLFREEGLDVDLPVLRSNLVTAGL